MHQASADYRQPGTITLEDKRFKLQFDPPALWSNIRNALASVGNNEWGGASDALLKGMATFSATNSLDHKAFSLVFNALQSACVGVMTDRMEQRQLMEKLLKAGPLTTDFYSHMSRQLSTEGYTLDLTFWQNPKQHPAVKDAQADYQSFLIEVFQMQPPQARVLAAALPARFVQALAAEWDRQDYQEIWDYFEKNPFLKDLQQQALHDKRHADLLSRFAKPAFDDPQVTLAEMYIEPECWIHGACLEGVKEHSYERIEREKGDSPYFQFKNGPGLHNYVASWLRGEKKWNVPGENSPLLVLLGQPGQGKTSFCLRTAYQLLEEEPGIIDQLYLIRLRDMTSINRLEEAPLTVIIEELQVPRQAGETGLPEDALRNSLLLLDGLDELFMSQGLTLSQVNNLIRNLLVQLRKQAALNCRVILTSRTNYLKLENQQARDFLILHLAELSLAQQLAWLKKYKKHYNNGVLDETLLQNINDLKKPQYKAIKELINQPILLHLVAASGVNPENSLNAARIYEELFDLMIQRKWSPEDGQLEKYKSLKPEDLRRFLQQLAHYIFQSDHEHVKRLDFEKDNSELKEATEKLRNKMGFKDLPIQDLVKDLLVSFYFQETTRPDSDKRKSEDPDHYAFEFLHKSLQEYLTAEFIWQKCKAQLLHKDTEGDFHLRKWDQAMEQFIMPLFEKKVLSHEIAHYLREIAQNDPDQSARTVLKERIIALMPGLLEHQFLKQHNKDDLTMPLEKMAANFYGFWTLASALIQEHKLPSALEETYESAIERAVALENLVPYVQIGLFIRMVNNLQQCDTRSLNLQHQNLREADLRGADLRWADLSGADLSGADLRWADLSGAYLSGAYLSGAGMSGADLSGAYLSGADLSGAYLSGADLRWAGLSGADLSGADLSDIRGIKTALGLGEANFKDTIYEGEFGPKKKDE